MYQRITHRYTNLHHLESNPALRKQALAGYITRSRSRALNDFMTSRLDLERASIPYSKEDLQMILAVNMLLTVECRSYGIKSIKLPRRKVVLLPEKAFGDFFPKLKDRALGCYDVVPDIVAVIALSGRKSDWSYFSVLLHEGIHWASKTTILHDVETKKNIIVSNGHSTAQHGVRQISGGILDEAVTEKLTKEILFRNTKLIERMVPSLKAWDCVLGVGLYDRFVVLLDSAINALASQKGAQPASVWRAFKHAHFRGGMQHLKELDRYLGAGSANKLTEIPWDPEEGNTESTIREVERATAYFRGTYRKLMRSVKNLATQG